MLQAVRERRVEERPGRLTWVPWQLALALRLVQQQPSGVQLSAQELQQLSDSLRPYSVLVQLGSLQVRVLLEQP